MKKDVLFLECRGCYFWNNDPINNLSDVGNYRVGAYDNPIKAKDGKTYVLEFGGYDKRMMRYNNLRTGKPLKHPKYEIVLKNALHINTQFENENGCYRNIELEKQIHNKNYCFTKTDILKAVNEISIKQYKSIILVSHEKIINCLEFIYNLGGFREKNILDNLVEVKTELYTKDYEVYRFIDNSGNTFDYEYKSKRITN